MVNKHVGIILARGGSKRIPKKNLLDFFGKPMVAWTIEAAFNSKKFDRILLSTDSQEIADVAVSFGLETPFLRLESCDDEATSSSATLVALEQAEKHWGERYNLVSQLMGNCPLRSHIDIQKAIDHFNLHSVSSQISCFKFGWMNPWWSAQISAEGKPKYLFQDEVKYRSQDLPSLYCPSGAIWTAKANEVRKHKSFYTPDHSFFELGWKSSVDIDDMDDYEMAKACFRL